MKNLLVLVPALALVVAVSAGAYADNGAINEATLQDMGLAGMSILSDQDSMEVRGMGSGPGMSKLYKLKRLVRRKKQLNVAFGLSYAHVELPRGATGKAGSIDGYLSVGKFHAEGAHYSEAGYSIKKTKALRISGKPARKRIRTTDVLVWAGGDATSTSY